MRAADQEQAKWLNSATGVTFPSSSMVPPMMMTSFTLRNVSTSSSAASARFASGPTATIVIVSGLFERRSSRIFLCAGTAVGMKFGGVGPSGWSSGEDWNMCCQVSVGVNWGACFSHFVCQ